MAKINDVTRSKKHATVNEKMRKKMVKQKLQVWSRRPRHVIVLRLNLHQLPPPLLLRRDDSWMAVALASLNPAAHHRAVLLFPTCFVVPKRRRRMKSFRDSSGRGSVRFNCGSFSV